MKNMLQFAVAITLTTVCCMPLYAAQDVRVQHELNPVEHRQNKVEVSLEESVEIYGVAAQASAEFIYDSKAPYVKKFQGIDGLSFDSPVITYWISDRVSGSGFASVEDVQVTATDSLGRSVKWISRLDTDEEGRGVIYIHLYPGVVPVDTYQVSFSVTGADRAGNIFSYQDSTFLQNFEIGLGDLVGESQEGECLYEMDFSHVVPVVNQSSHVDEHQVDVGILVNLHKFLDDRSEQLLFDEYMEAVELEPTVGSIKFSQRQENHKKATYSLSEKDYQNPEQILKVHIPSAAIVSAKKQQGKCRESLYDSLEIDGDGNIQYTRMLASSQSADEPKYVKLKEEMLTREYEMPLVWYVNEDLPEGEVLYDAETEKLLYTLNVDYDKVNSRYSGAVLETEAGAASVGKLTGADNVVFDFGVVPEGEYTIKGSLRLKDRVVLAGEEGYGSQVLADMPFGESGVLVKNKKPELTL